MNKNFREWLRRTTVALDKKAELKVVAAPTYPLRDAMSVEQARERVAADFRRWLRSALEWWSGDVDPFESFAREVLQEGEPEPPVHAQKSPTGVGKTKIGAKEIAEDRRARQRAGDNGPMATQPYLYFGPTHRLNDNTTNDFRDVDLTAQVYRGRFALDPNVEGNKERPEKEQVLMCLAPERVKQAMALYQSISETCCRKRVDGKVQECEHFNACAFQRQLRGEQPDVWLAAHEMLFHDQQALSDVAGIIIDETFYQDGLSGIEEPREALTLDEIAILGDGVDDSTLVLHREKLVEILKKHSLGGLRRDHFIVETEPPPDAPDRIKGIVGQALHPEDCTEAIRKEWAIFGRLVITPGMTEAEIEALKDIIPDCVRARRMVGVWGALREMLEREDIRVSGRLILARKDGKTILRVRGVRPVLDARRVPTMLLDATLPSKAILEKFYPQVEVVSDVEVRMPHIHVRQVVNAPVSQNKLWGTEQEPSKGHNLHAIRRYILRRWLEIDGPRLWRESRPRRPMVVICQKEVRLWLENAPTDHRWYGKVPHPGVALPEGMALEHFNAIAGLDDHKGVRLLVTIGRTLPPPAAVEAIAGALTGAQPALEAPTGRGYGRVPRAVRLADDRGVLVENCDEHVDAVAEAVRYQICEAELVQAIGRGREVNRTAETPLDIDIVADVVLPITVDEVVPWEEPSELVEMLARDAIALTAQGDMARAWPSVWENTEAARYALKKLGIKVRAGGVPIEQVGKSLLGIFLIGKFPLAIFVYRRAVAGAHLAVALFDPSQLPNPGVWIKEKCGELAERLHFLWQWGEIPPLAGAGKVEIADRLVWILRKPRYALSADYKQHKAYTGVGRPGRYTLSKDPQAMAAYDGSPGGITTPYVDAYGALPLELRVYALGLHETDLVCGRVQ
jgi:hypothetical protein